MPAYVVAFIDEVTDRETYAAYVAQVEATLAPFGGRFLARKPDPKPLEGGPAPSRAVVLGFASEEKARAWHASPAYQPVMKLRQSASRGMLLVLPAYQNNAPHVADNEICHLEKVVDDVAAAQRFHENVHGWCFDAPNPVLGGAVVANLPSGVQCAIRAPMSAVEKPLTRAYVRVPDIDEAVARAERLGAKVALPAVELPGQGKIAICIVAGVEHGLWERA